MTDKTQTYRFCLAALAAIIIPLPAIAQTLQKTKNPPFINAKHDLLPLGIHTKNAAGDAKTDDTKAIQAAIDYLAKAGKDTLILPPGTFRIQSITLKQGVRLTGAGTKKTSLRPPDHNFYAMITVNGGSLENLSVFGTPTEKVSAENWKIGEYSNGKHRGGSTSRPVHLIQVRDAQNGALITNVNALESRYDCLYVRGSKGLRVRNCKFDRAGRNVVSMVGTDEDFVFTNCTFGSIWGLYHFDIEPQNGRYVRDGLFVNCLFDGTKAGQMNSNKKWGQFLCFKGHDQLKSTNITLLGCSFHNIFIRVNHTFCQPKFLYNTFDNAFSKTQIASLIPEKRTGEVEWGMGADQYQPGKQQDKTPGINYPGRTFVRVYTNPVGEFRDAVVRGNKFLTARKPAERINFGVEFTGKSIFQDNFPDKFNENANKP